MNPQRLGLVSEDKWNSIMEESFLPAAGKRRTCGARPKCLVRCKLDKNKNHPCCQNLRSYMKCVDEVRKANISAGLPMDEGLPSDAPSGTEIKDTLAPKSETTSALDTASSAKMWTNVAIGLGVAAIVGVAIWQGVKIMRKAKAAPAMAAV